MEEKKEQENKEDNERPEEKNRFSIIMTAVIAIVLILLAVFWMRCGGHLQGIIFLVGAVISLISYEIGRVIEWKKKK